MENNKHYIRLDSDGYIIHAYSDASEAFENGDICIEEHGGRQLVINGVVNPALYGLTAGPLYRYANGEVISDPKAIPVIQPEPTEIEKEVSELKSRLRSAEYAAAENSATNQELLELLIEMEVI